MGFLYNDISATFAYEDREKNRILCLIAYIPLLFFVPVLFASRSPVAKFHANQGFALSVALVVCSLIASVFWLLSLPLSLFTLIIFIMELYGAVNASRGTVIEYPVLSGIRLFK
ncbi:MAG: hypothetical protein IKV97_01450 [Clostridia bacterium]|nr:hypothetical protein [Clostridia bacterium]